MRNTLSLCAVILALFLALVAMTGCGGGNSDAKAIAYSAYNVKLILSSKDGVEQDTAGTYLAQIGETVNVEALWAIGGHDTDKPSEIQGIFGGTIQYNNDGKFRGGPTTDSTGVVMNVAGEQTVTYDAIAPDGTKWQKSVTIKWSATATPAAQPTFNPVIRSYRPSTNLNGSYIAASSNTLQRDGDNFIATISQKLVVEMDRVDHRGDDIQVDPYAPLEKEVKVVVVDDMNREVSTTYGEYYWQNGLAFSVNQTGLFTAKISVILSNNTQLNFERTLRVDPVVADGPMTLKITWHYYDGSLRDVNLVDGNLWVLNGNRFDIKASKPGWEGASQEIVVFNTVTQVSPPLMVGNDYITGLPSGTGDGTVRVILRRGSDMTYTDFHVFVIDGLGFSRAHK